MLEIPKHPFHQSARLVQLCVIVTKDRSVRSWRDHDHGSGLLHPVDQLIRIIPLVGQHGVRLEPFEERLGLCTVMPFPPCYNEPERIAQCIAHGLQFRGKPAPAPP